MVGDATAVLLYRLALNSAWPARLVANYLIRRTERCPNTALPDRKATAVPEFNEEARRRAEDWEASLCTGWPRGDDPAAYGGAGAGPTRNRRAVPDGQNLV